MALIDDFKTRFPEFNSIEVDTYFPLIENTWDCYYGGSYTNECDQEAILNLLAHLFVDETTSGTESNKVIQSKSVGSVSVSYANNTYSGGERYDFFSSTKYGKRFLMLTQKNKGAYFV